MSPYAIPNRMVFNAQTYKWDWDWDWDGCGANNRDVTGRDGLLFDEPLVKFLYNLRNFSQFTG